MNTITRHRGFTLIELMVVISIVVLVSIGVIPAARKMLQAQTGAQAASLFSAQLSAARAEAIVSGKYTALHSQLSNRKDETEDQCFLAVLSYQALDSNNSGLAMAPGNVPLPVPGNQAYGRLDSTDYISGTSFANIDNDDLEKFTTLTVLFDRQGQVTPLMNTTGGFENPQVINANSKKLFSCVSNDLSSGTALWRQNSSSVNPNNGPVALLGNKPSVSGACVFDFKKLSLLPKADRKAYLNTHARILPINTYTGSLFDMKQDD